MPDPIPPKSDPDFQIISPANGVTVGPNFSVTGCGPKNLQNLGVQVGTTTMPAAQETDSFYWEAVFANMAGGGPYVVQASYANGFFPLTPQSLKITVVDAAGITINQPQVGAGVGDSAGAAAGGGDNPWANWKVEGTYEPPVIDEIQLFLTRRGRAVDVSLGVKATKLARIYATTGKWECYLDFVPANYRGQHFLLHYRAKLLHGGTYIYGTCVSTFTGPS